MDIRLSVEIEFHSFFTNNSNYDKSKLLSFSAFLTDTKLNTMDTSALNGLRGILSLHVMVCHYIHAIGMAGLDMNFFCAISGFTLGLIYVKRDLKKWEFYRNRFARIVPIYYLTEIFGLFHKIHEDFINIRHPKTWKKVALIFTATNE